MIPQRIKSPMVPPPGGVYFIEVEGERVESRTWADFELKAMELLRKHGVHRSVIAVASEQMCPFMPDWYCFGAESKHFTTVKEARNAATKYYSRHVVPFDVMSERLRACSRCRCHQRAFCLTCTGILDQISAGFGGRRVRVPEDNLAGTCSCAGTFEPVVAAVEYGKDEAPWEGCPENCWRRTENAR